MNLSIGELARRTGTKVPTIRYYEQIGLMPLPPRTEGKQRRYNMEHVTQLKFVRHARELGFEVGVIRELLTLSAKPNESCKQVDEIARRHITENDQRIAHFIELRTELQCMVDECECERVSKCRVIETLAYSAHEHRRAS
jgi:DNA-binding transcriptional MerR regulator